MRNDFHLFSRSEEAITILRRPSGLRAEQGMNKAYKVVFKKARGALMAVNEISSSVRGKGAAKSVVALAALAAAGGIGCAYADAGKVVVSDGKTEQ